MDFYMINELALHQDNDKKLCLQSIPVLQSNEALASAHNDEKFQFARGFRILIPNYPVKFQTLPTSG